MAKKVQFTTNQPSATTDYLAADNTWKTIPGGGGGGGVPYTGATANVDLGEYGLSGGFIEFDTTPTGTPTTQGTMSWDTDHNTVQLVMNGHVGQVMQDTFYFCKNQTGSTIAKGTVVRADGTLGASGRIKIAPFLADGTYPSEYLMGVTAEAIADGADGMVMHFGQLRQLNTSAFTDGDILYASTTSAGAFTTTIPSAPNNIVEVAIVIHAAVNGVIQVRPTIGSNINKDEGVKITSVANNDILKYNSTSGLWENSNALSTKQDTITGAASTITTSNLTGSRALVSDGGGKVAVSAVSTTELGRLIGVTSDIQTQLNAKANTGSGTSFLTGTVGNANTSVAAGATNYVGLTGSGLSISENIRVTVFPQDCTLSRLYFGTGTTQPATGSLVITLRKNNADTALVITIAAGSLGNFYSNTVNSVSYTAGQYASIKVVNNASAASAAVNCLAIMVTI